MSKKGEEAMSKMLAGNMQEDETRVCVEWAWRREGERRRANR
ncbi:MAG TPA: hypothetical protein VGO47_05870 [Chlamydiales bacterium]|nr:hypothetical protein [Chlamydiales bacterium]